MSTLTRVRLRGAGLATVMSGVMMSLFLGGQAEASAIQNRAEHRLVSYATSATLGVAEEPPISFLEVDGVGNPSTSTTPGATFAMPGVFSLGTFTAMAVPSGVNVLLERYPFSITLSLFADSAGRSAVSQIVINGTLDGELSSKPGAGLIASVSSVSQVGTPIGTPPFRVEDLQMLAPQFISPAGSLQSRSTPIYGYVNVQVPEPTALATLGLGFVALVARRRHQARRIRMGRTA